MTVSMVISPMGSSPASAWNLRNASRVAAFSAPSTGPVSYPCPIWVHLHFVVGFRPGGHIGRFFAFFRIHFDDCRILRNQYPGQKPDFKENGDCTHYPQQTEQQRNSPSYLQVRVPESRAVDQNNRSERNCNPLSAEFTHLWQSHKCNSDSVLRLLRIVEIYLDLRLTQTDPQLHRSVSSSPFFGVT